MPTTNLTQALTPLMASKIYKAGEVITSNLAKAEQVFLIAEGAAVVEFTTISTDKDRRIGTLLTENSFIGLENAFHKKLDARAQVTALKDSVVLSISATAFLELLSNGKLSAGLHTEVSVVMAEALYELRHRLESMALHANYPKDSVFSMLGYLGKHLGISNGRGGVTIPVKIGTLAVLTGLSEESTRRAVSLLVEEQRVAKIGKGNFLIFA